MGVLSTSTALLAVLAVVAGETNDETCSLYMAPSSLSNAGLGVYTGVDVAQGQAIASEYLKDLYVPIFDKHKVVPYRGEQHFLSWLGYIWPAEIDTFYTSYNDGTFPSLSSAFHKTNEGLNGANEGLNFYGDPEQKRFPLSVFAPGIASLMNSQYYGANVLMNDETMERDEIKKMHPNDFLHTPHHGVSFKAEVDIPAASELFIYYGDEWHARNQELEEGTAEYRTLESYKETELVDMELRSEEDKRREMLRMKMVTSHNKRPIGALEKQRRLDVEKILSEPRTSVVTESPLKNVQDTPTTKRPVPVEPQKSPKENRKGEALGAPTLEWLQSNGACMDKLRVGPSLIEGAGRGAFANRFLPKGSSIAPSPLLALKREDLDIYGLEKNSTVHRKVLDTDKILGQELLLNYCYGHSDSEMLLVPYFPMVNFINHHSDASKVNAEIRWPDEETAQKLLKRSPKEWLGEHPLDVMQESGKLMMEFVALRDIEPDEEIFIDYGSAWQSAWEQREGKKSFRHEIEVPKGFFPDNWLHQSVHYEIAPVENLKPGEVVPLTWKHNGQHIARNAYVVGLPENLTAHMKEFADRRGINSLYEQLLAEKLLDSDEWYVFDADQHGEESEQWFAQRYKSVAWDFNMHYIAAWDEPARQSVFRSLGQAGYDTVLDGIGTYFGLDTLTCFHTSFMGVSEADKSMMHTDVYATGEVGYNIIFPIITVDGSKPELDIQSDDADIVVAAKYEHDRAFVMADWGYHKTSAVEYAERGQIRVVMGMYCGQIDETNNEMMKLIYDGEDPAPFMDQFELPLQEIHWGKGHKLPK